MAKNNKLPKLLKQSEVLEIIPVSLSTWLRGVVSGRYPRPIRFGRIKFWDRKEILALRQAGL